MIPKEKAELRLNCLYAAISIMGVNSSASSAITKGEKEPKPRPRATTEEVLKEAKKLWGWVSSKKGNGR